MSGARLTPPPDHTIRLSPGEHDAVKHSIKASISLYDGYCKLNPEHDASPWLMKRKQTIHRKRLAHLRSALAKL